jgi:hypothetical protein
MAVIAQANGFYFDEGDLNYCVDYIEMFGGQYDLRLLAKSKTSTQWSYTDGVEFDTDTISTTASCDAFLAEGIKRFNEYLGKKHGKVEVAAPVNGVERLEWSLNNLSYNTDTKQIEV